MDQHRDLHLGNICVKSRDDNQCTRLLKRVEPENGMRLGQSGLKVTIIDYTLSRVKVEEDDGSDNEPTAFFDLGKDPALFEGIGDYQYDIYR